MSKPEDNHSIEGKNISQAADSKILTPEEEQRKKAEILNHIIETKIQPIEVKVADISSKLDYLLSLIQQETQNQLAQNQPAVETKLNYNSSQANSLKEKLAANPELVEKAISKVLDKILGPDQTSSSFLGIDENWFKEQLANDVKESFEMKHLVTNKIIASLSGKKTQKAMTSVLEHGIE